MKKWQRYLIIFLVMVTVSMSSTAVLAFKVEQTGLTTSAEEAKYNLAQTNIAVMVGNILNGVLVLIGLALMIVIIYGGLRYMLAGGNEEEVRKARQWIINGILGVIIISLAYALSSYVLARIGAATAG